MIIPKKKKKVTDIRDAKPHRPDKYKLLKALSEKQVMAAVDFIAGDGHTIFPMEHLVKKCHWPKETAEAVCQEYTSDGSAKGSIFKDDGEVIESCKGWYSLDVMYALATALDVKYEGCMGRGFQARAIDTAIRKHFNQEVKE